MLIIMFLGFSVAIWILYHKMFDVMYFDLGRGLLKELGASLLGGLILTTLAVMYWWVVVIIIAIAALILAMKFNRTEQRILVAVAAVVIAIAVAVTGISFNNKNKEEKQQEVQEYSYIVEEVC